MTQTIAAHSVKYLKPPAPIPAKGAKTAPPTAGDDLASFGFRHRWNLAPFGVELGVATVAHLASLGPDPLSLAWAPLGLAGAYAMERTDWLAAKLDRTVERRYAGGVMAAAGAWTTWATWWGQVPSGLSLAVLTGATVALGVPWWRHRAVRDKVPVEFLEMGAKARKRAFRLAHRIASRWPQAMVDAGTVGVDLCGFRFEAHHITMDVKLPGKLTLDEFRKRAANQGRLENALELRRGSVRVFAPADAANSRHVRVRVMLADPFAARDPITPAEHSGHARIGKSEVGEPIIVDLTKHMLVAGRSGSGKTGLVHNLIRAATEIPWMVVIGIDVQPGAVEFGPWEDAMLKPLGRSVGDAEVIFDALMREAGRRGALMKKRGWRNWECSEAEPHIMTVIDEVQLITEEKKIRDKQTRADRLAELAGLIRKFGMSLVIATQYPTDKYVPTKVKEQMFYSIGLRTKSQVADRVIFGEHATEQGWHASQLPSDRPGYFYIEGGVHDSPVICLTDDLPDSVLERVQQEAPVVTAALVVRPGATGLDTTFTYGEPTPAPEESDNLPAVPGGGPGPVRAPVVEEDVVDAVEVPQTFSDRVRAAVGALPPEFHRAQVEAMADVDQKTADKYIKEMVEEGLLEKVGPARYRRT